MPALINSDDGVVSGSSGLKTTGANDGILALQNNGTTNVTVTAAGNVGIGTSSPSGRLDVVGAAGALTNAIVRCTDSNMARLTFSNTNRNWTISNYGAQFNPNGALVFADETAGATRAWIDTSGNFAFNSGYGSVATAFGCRAWVNFNGTGTVAIRASGNVSSITDLGVGVYRANFTTAMPDANFAVNLTAGNFPTTTNTLLQAIVSTSSDVTLYAYAAGVSTDLSLVYAAIFR